MATVQSELQLLEEVVDFLASSPSHAAIVKFRPSAKAQKRVSQLLKKLKNKTISSDETWELDQVEYLESMMRLLKAKCRPGKRS